MTDFPETYPAITRYKPGTKQKPPTQFNVKVVCFFVARPRIELGTS